MKESGYSCYFSDLLFLLGATYKKVEVLGKDGINSEFGAFELPRPIVNVGY